MEGFEPNDEMSMAGYDCDAGDYTEPQPNPEGVYRIRLNSVKPVDANGKPTYKIYGNVMNPREDIVNPQPCSMTLWLPNKEDSAKQQNDAKGNILALLIATGLVDEGKKLTPEVAAKMVGLEVYAFVTKTLGKDGKIYNNIKRFTKPPEETGV